MYSIEYSKILSVAPKPIIKGSKKILTTIQSIIPIIINVLAAVPAVCFDFSGKPFPNSKLKFEAPPIPKVRPIARHIVVIGKAIFVAAFPK